MNPLARRSTQRPTIEEIIARAARLGITPDRVLLEYRRIAFADPSLLFEMDEDGTYRLKPFAKIDPEVFAAIHELIPVDSGHFRIKFYDKRSALEVLARVTDLIPPPRRSGEPVQPEQAEQGEDPRDTLARALARLAGETAAGDGAGTAEPGAGADPAA